MQQKSVNQQKTITNHTLVIDNMSKINITGVHEVITATDKAILCKLGTGFLQVGGETLRVEKLMPEEQLLIASGIALLVALVSTLVSCSDTLKESPI